MACSFFLIGRLEGKIFGWLAKNAQYSGGQGVHREVESERAKEKHPAQQHASYWKHGSVAGTLSRSTYGLDIGTERLIGAGCD
jgi:hypothetical protein